MDSKFRGYQGPSTQPSTVSLRPWAQFQGKSSGFLSQGVLGHFRNERWQAVRLLWICKRRQSEWRKVPGWAPLRLYFTEGKEVVFFKKGGPLLGLISRFCEGLIVLILSGFVHSFIIHLASIYSFSWFFRAFSRYQVLCQALVIQWRTGKSLALRELPFLVGDIQGSTQISDYSVWECRGPRRQAEKKSVFIDGGQGGLGRMPVDEKEPHVEMLRRRTSKCRGLWGLGPDRGPGFQDYRWMGLQREAVPDQVGPPQLWF
jgi:hypothetical protein